MIQNVIFDLGNVLLRFAPDELIMSQYNDESVKVVLMRSVFKAPEWLLMDRGELTDAEATEAFIKHAPEYAEEIRAIMKIWPRAITPIGKHIEILEDLKTRGFNCYVLSNFPKDAYEAQEALHPFFKKFDGGIVSAYVHHIKPEKEIYERLFEKYDLDPSTCLLLDDRPENIEAGKALGMKGIEVTHDLDLKRAVESYCTGTV